MGWTHTDASGNLIIRDGEAVEDATDVCGRCGAQWTDEPACPSCGRTIEQVAQAIAEAK